MEANLGKFLAVQHLGAEHVLLNLGTVLFGNFFVDNPKLAGVDGQLHCGMGLIEGTLLNRGADFVLMSESREQTGFEDVHGHDGFLRVNAGLSRGAQGNQT